MMKVKDNQPGLLSWIESPMHPTQQRTEVETLDQGHGRKEKRTLIASSALKDAELWPGLEQCFKLETERINIKSGEKSKEVTYGITSLSQQQAEAERLLELNRQHWHIENKSHWVRDVTFDEDRSQARLGSIAEVMAAMRNAVIGLMRGAGESNIAKACRKFAAQPWAALSILGIKS